MQPVFNRVLIIVAMLAGLATPVFASVSNNDNPGGDQPDESFMLGDALYPADIEAIKPAIDEKSKIAVLDSGYSREAVLFFSQYLPVSVVDERELSSRASSINFLVIPSGGLSLIHDPDKFRDALKKFVLDGGVLLVLSQRFGRDYSNLHQEMSVKGYGWLEDQSSLYQSAILTMWHPVVSGLARSRTNLNIDGFITSWPANGKPLLRNSISGQPVVLYYKFGKGSIIISSLFTDWAYLHGRATNDEIALISRLLEWSGLTLAATAPKIPDGGRSNYIQPEALPAVGFSVHSDHEIYNSGTEAIFTISLWNNRDSSRTIHVFYDGNARKIRLLPYGNAGIVYTSTVYSSRRLWVYFYDENEIFLQTLKKGYTVVYPGSEE